jgi:tryptophan 2,3-dioxygenase
MEVALDQRVGHADDEEIEAVKQDPERRQQPKANVKARHRRVIQRPPHRDWTLHHSPLDLPTTTWHRNRCDGTSSSEPQK